MHPEEMNIQALAVEVVGGDHAAALELARRAKLAELGERVILMARMRTAGYTAEECWAITMESAMALGLLPGEEGKPEYEPDPTGEYHLRIKRPGEEAERG